MLFRTSRPIFILSPVPVLLALCLAPRLHAQRNGNGFQNLKVLPSNIPREELFRAMLDNLRGLGLPRLQGRGCLFCHVGDMDEPRDSWDWASDEKLTKRKARVMMAMVREINERHLPRLEKRIDSTLRVTCRTCHAGRTDPRPLPDVLLTAYQAGGIDSVETRYRALRERYFGGGAYDFRVGVLAGVATQLADRGEFEDAIAVTTLNVDVYPNEPRAKRDWLRLVLERVVNKAGAGAALQELERREQELHAEVISPGLLDVLGWRLFRQDRRDEAIVILRANLARFPNEYVPNESVAFALWDSGDQESALRILEDWLERHPNHDRARRLLINLRKG